MLRPANCHGPTNLTTHLEIPALALRANRLPSRLCAQTMKSCLADLLLKISRHLTAESARRCSLRQVEQAAGRALGREKRHRVPIVIGPKYVESARPLDIQSRHAVVQTTMTS